MPDLTHIETRALQWLENYNGTDSFLTSIQYRVRSGGAHRLSERQLEAVVQNFQRVNGDTPRPAASIIPNGAFVLKDSAGSLYQFQIYTVQSGSLAGRRIFKVKTTYGHWKGFAFLEEPVGESPRLKEWSNNTVASTSMVSMARAVLEMLWKNYREGGDAYFNYQTVSSSHHRIIPNSTYFYYGYTLDVSFSCQQCNMRKRLTTEHARPSQSSLIHHNCAQRSFPNGGSSAAYGEMMRISLDLLNAVNARIRDERYHASNAGRNTAEEVRSRATSGSFPPPPPTQENALPSAPMSEVLSEEVR